MHVGDYEAATAHLSMLEDAAYGRMMRIYYRTEKPLPADIKQVCRLVRAQSKPERDAVQSVLEDFFVLADDGWHQARCDEELQAYRDREPEREAKKANEDTRLKRHRDERAALFRVLNDAGQHAPWNIKMEALRALVAALQEQPATAPATQPATPETPSQPLPATAPATPATATHGNVSPPPTSHLPPPTSQSPEIGEGIQAAKPPPARKRATRPPTTVTVADMAAEGVAEQHAADWLAIRKAKRLPLTPTAWADAKAEAAKAGMSVAEAIQASAANGWAGFRASWVASRDAPHANGAARPANRQLAVEAENRRVLSEWLGQPQEQPQ